MTTLYKEAGKRILAVRVMKEVSREELAEKAAITTKFIYEIETGRKGFSGKVLYKICTALNVDCDYILTGKVKEPYDHKLMETIKMFGPERTNNLRKILMQIYKLL